PHQRYLYKALTGILAFGVIATMILRRRFARLQTAIMHGVVALMCMESVESNSARADIFQWEYINPADPSQGKRQSTTLAPGGAGANAVPLANLDGRNLTKAYLIGLDVHDASFVSATLTNADLSQSNLTNAVFSGTTFSGADLTGAEVRGAR